MIQPFFCAICDKKIRHTKGMKDMIIHPKCLEKYLSDFSVQNKEEYRKSRTINNKYRTKW